MRHDDQHKLPSSEEEGTFEPKARTGVVDGRPRRGHAAAHNLPAKQAQRRELRSNLTAAEASLWQQLKGSQLAGRKFRRQHSIGSYVVDFYCPTEQLVVELDGQGHFSPAGEAHDASRTQYLEQLGLRVLRFENRQWWNDAAGVLRTIAACFRQLPDGLP